MSATETSISLSKDTRNDLRRYKANCELRNYDEAIRDLLDEAADD